MDGDNRFPGNYPFLFAFVNSCQTLRSQGRPVGSPVEVLKLNRYWKR
jgi:hypothetical protein